MEQHKQNRFQAARNRGFFDAKNILAIKIVSSQGAGKTMLIEKSIERLINVLNVFVIEEKQRTDMDAEMVLKIISDFYEKEYNKCILITGDGDFSCLIEFLKEKEVLEKIIAPSEKRTSFLIINKNIEILFLDQHYKKFGERINDL